MIGLPFQKFMVTLALQGCNALILMLPIFPKYMIHDFIEKKIFFPLLWYSHRCLDVLGLKILCLFTAGLWLWWISTEVIVSFIYIPKYVCFSLYNSLCGGTQYRLIQLHLWFILCEHSSDLITHVTMHVLLKKMIISNTCTMLWWF